MRDFLYSEVANFYGIPNIPENPELAIEVGRQLCEKLLEPLQATFGRVAVRSGYRSLTVNQKGNDGGHNCGSNESNFAGHIWDMHDSAGLKGAMACVVVPWFTDRFEQGADWRGLASGCMTTYPTASSSFSLSSAPSTLDGMRSLSERFPAS
jgi:hypothetical protein